MLNTVFLSNRLQKIQRSLYNHYYVLKISGLECWLIKKMRNVGIKSGKGSIWVPTLDAHFKNILGLRNL